MPGEQVFPCPHCGMAYQLTPDYLAQYGGQATQCRQCQGIFALPMAQPIAAANAGAAQVLPYMAPMAAVSYGVWRDGNQIVASKGATLPPACVKCNGTEDLKSYRRTYSWHHPAWALLVLVAVLLYIVVALALRKSGPLTYSLCRRHRKRRAMALLWMWIGILGSFAVMFVGCSMTTERQENLQIGIVLGCIGVFLASLILGIIFARILTPKKIDDRFLYLSGACPEFLNTLPDAGFSR